MTFLEPTVCFVLVCAVHPTVGIASFLFSNNTTVNIETIYFVDVGMLYFLFTIFCQEDWP